MNDEVEQPGGRDDGLGGPVDSNVAEILNLCQTRAAGFMGRLHEEVFAALDKSIGELAESCPHLEEERRLLDELRVVRLSKENTGSALHDRFVRFYRDAMHPDRDARRPYLSVDAPTEGKFSLVNDQQLEEWLAIDRLIGKIDDFHTEEIQGLKKRFLHLLPELDGSNAEFPLGPDKFCHAFHEALECLDIGIATRIACYELLDHKLSHLIGEFYQQINKMMIERGILPELRIEPVSQHDGTSRNTTRARQRNAAEESWSDEVESSGEYYDLRQGSRSAGGQGPDSTPIQEQMFLAMQHLLNAHFSQASAGLATMFDGREVDAVDLPVTPMLVETLSALQHDDGLVERAGELIRGGLKHHVVGRFSGSSGSAGGGGDINRIDDETIEVISMIFDYILDDRSLPDFMKALIGRLQIPVLKVAIIDRGFFRRKSHPARQLLNELSHAGLGWREESEASKDRLFQKMEAIVRRILEEFEDDIGIFEELLTEFRAFLEEETERFNEAQAKILEAAQENERREKITMQLAQEIAKRLMHRQVPDDIREFLLTSWREYVTQIMLVEGEQSVTGNAALDFIEDLAWSLQPKQGAEERKRLVTLLPSLLDSLRAGMLHIGHPEPQTEQLIQSLEGHHFNCMKAARRGEDRRAPEQPTIQQQYTQQPESADASSEQHISEQPSPEETKVDQSKAQNDVDRVIAEISQDLDELSSIDWNDLTDFDDVIEMKSSDEQQRAFEKMIAEMGLELNQEQDDGPRIEDQFTELVRGLELGAWIELTVESGQTQRARLAWKGDDYSSFSFVNRQYKVVAERPLYVLAEEFRDGRATLIEEVALFDRAMNGVIGGLAKFATAAER